MAIGGLLAYINLNIRKKNINNYLSAIGIFLILLLAWVISEKSLFPGWWALMPTLSAVSIIAAGPNAWVNRNVLSNKVFVFIGKISYPLYLWHWPCLAYSRMFYNS